MDYESKSNARRALIKQRQTWSLDHEHCLGWAQTLCELLSTLIREQSCHCVGLYYPLPGEPWLIEHTREFLSAQETTLALPVVDPEIEGKMHFAYWGSDTPLVKRRFGVMEPAFSHEVTPECLVIPCLGYSEAGHRLGYGKGYYDRYLKAHPHCFTIGVAYEQACCPVWLFEPHDERCDWIVTQSRYFCAGKY